MWHTNPAHLQHDSECSQQGSHLDLSPSYQRALFFSSFQQTHTVGVHQLQAMGYLE